MLKRLSGLPDEKLNYYLDRVREIAGLGDEAAFIETDKLIYEFQGEDVEEDEPRNPTEWKERDAEIRLHNAKNELRYLQTKVNSLKTKLETDAPIRYWDANLSFSETIIGKTWSPDVREVLGKELDELKAVMPDILDRATKAGYYQLLDETLAAPIHNVVSSRNILDDIEKVIKFFTSRNLFDEELKDRVRQSRERIAWHRAKKKLADAKVAEAGGNLKGVAKRRSEAEALLAQDWAEVFPEETPPLIS